MADDRSLARQVGLVFAVFAATLVLLVGGWSLLTRNAGPGGSGSPSPVPAGSRTSPPTVGPSGGLPRPSFTPGPSGEPPTVTIVGAGDIGDCTRDGATRTSDILVNEPGWIFTAGDNAYENGSAADYRACYAPTWGRLKDRTILPAPGNHDWNTPGAAGYLGYFGAAAAPEGVTWYSTDLGAWHVVVLDSNCDKVGGCDASSPQGRWLARDLAASTAHCTLAIWHHPLFSSGEHGNAPEVRPFWDALLAAGAELVINGHDHDYERFAPQTADGAELRPGGLREIVAGTGGGELRAFHALAPNSEFRLAGSWGVLRLTLHPANYVWEYLPAAGEIADSGSTPCH